MTVIAWDGKTLAADRQGNWADMRISVEKIRRLPTGEVIAATGDSDRCLAVLEWYAQGADPEKWPKCQTSENYARLIIARPGKGLLYLEGFPVEQSVFEPFMAFGSGRDFAMGAMAMGADAERAVEVASRFSTACGMGVDAFEVG